jgi:hypothetical protein
MLQEIDKDLVGLIVDCDCKVLDPPNGLDGGWPM